MGWPIAFPCFALLQLPGLLQFLSAFSDPSCQPGSCASALCLPAHHKPDFSLWCLVHTPPWLSSHRRADFACTSIKWLSFNQLGCFSLGSSQPRAPGTPGRRSSRYQIDVPMCVLCVRDRAPAWHLWAEPPHPSEMWTIFTQRHFPYTW